MLHAEIKIATHTSDFEGNGLDDKWTDRRLRGAAAMAIRPEDFEEEFGPCVTAEFADEETEAFPTAIFLDRTECWIDPTTGETYLVNHGTVVTIEYEDDRYDRD